MSLAIAGMGWITPLGNGVDPAPARRGDRRARLQVAAAADDEARVPHDPVKRRASACPPIATLPQCQGLNTKA